MFDLSIVGIVGLPASYGGFETLAEQIVLLNDGRLSIQVFCSGGRDRSEANSPFFAGASLRFLNLKANGWQSAVYDFVSMWLAAPKSRAILVLGVSGCLALPIIRLRSPKTRIITNIDGLEWKRRKWGYLARAFLWASEWVAIRCSHCVVSDNLAIQNYVTGVHRRKSVLIAYGGDRRESGGPVFRDRRMGFEDQEYFISVCRIEPENNVEEMLEAFAASPEKTLVAVGNWAVSNYARELRKRYVKTPNISMLDPIYDAPRLDELRKGAIAYVHGHSAGGTNPSLVEAMYSGLAVLAFDVSYNRHTTEDAAYYWKSSFELRGLLASCDGNSLKECAYRMKAIAHCKYSWRSVVDSYFSLLN